MALLQVYKRGVARPGEAEDLYAVGFEIFQVKSGRDNMIGEERERQRSEKEGSTRTSRQRESNKNERKVSVCV